MDNIDTLLLALEPEIDKKCGEIKQRKKEKLMTRLFIVMAAAFLTIPAALVFMGVTLLTIFLPILFAAAGFLILSPLLISEGGLLYE